MQRNVFLGIAAVVILAIAGVWFSVPASDMNSGDTASTTAPRTVQNTATPPVISPSKPATNKIGGGNTYHSLLTQKGSYQCDYNQVSQSGQSQHVVYISNGKLRAEFRNMSPGQQSATLSVYDGTYLYEWHEGMAVGAKTLLTSLSQLPSAIPKDLMSGGVVGDNSNSVGWHCHPWLVDAKLLVAPSYVKF